MCVFACVKTRECKKDRQREERERFSLASRLWRTCLVNLNQFNTKITIIICLF